MHLGLQFSVYGENLFIFAQNLAIIGMMWHFDRTIGAFQKLMFATFISVYAYVLFSGMMPEDGWAIVSSSSLVVGLVSRIPQIWQNYCAKSTGALAFVTFFLMFLGTIARAATIFFESKDVMLRSQMALALAMNTIIVFQFAIYWNSKEPTAQPTPSKKVSVYDKVNSKTETKPETKKTK